MGPLISPVHFFSGMAQPIQSLQRSKYLLYCKLRKKYISRKKWSKYRFAEYLLSQKKFTKTELIRYKLLSKRQIYAPNAHLRSTQKTPKRGRPRLITEQQERKLVDKYKALHRDGHAGTIKHLQSDVCTKNFIFKFFVEYFLGISACAEQ